MGLVTIGQGFMSLSNGNRVGFIICIFAAMFFLTSIFFYITRKTINKKQRSKWDLEEAQNTIKKQQS